MNDEQKKKIILKNSLLWGAALMTPPIVMVIVDATTRETPSQNAIAIGSTFALMALFIFSNAMLSGVLNSIPKNVGDSGESNESPQ